MGWGDNFFTFCPENNMSFKPICICCSLPSWSILKFDAIKMYSILVRFKLSLFAITFSKFSFAIVRASTVVLVVTDRFVSSALHTFLQRSASVACAASELNSGIVRLRISARFRVQSPSCLASCDWPLSVSGLSGLVIGEVLSLLLASLVKNVCSFPVCNLWNLNFRTLSHPVAVLRAIRFAQGIDMHSRVVRIL